MDRMALVQDTTADKVTMPEEYYRQLPSKGGEQPRNGQQQGTGTQRSTGNEFMDSMLQGNMNFSELLNSLSPEVRQALESGSMVQLLSSLRGMLPNVSNNPEETKKQKKASLLAMYLNIVFYVLAAFSSLVKICIAYYATSGTARWITEHTVGSLFAFFHTVENVENFPQVKFKLGLLQLIILFSMAYYGLVYKVAGMGLMSFLGLLFKGILGITVVHILMYTILWCIVYISH